MNLPETRTYNRAFRERGRDDVVLWDVLQVEDGQTVRVVFESSNSAWRHGVWLKTDRGLFVNGQDTPSVRLWRDTAPETVEVTCRTQDGRLHVYNIWDSGRGYGMESQTLSSGMLAEDHAWGVRYRCNDIGFDTDFSRLVFRLELQPV